MGANGGPSTLVGGGGTGTKAGVEALGVIVAGVIYLGRDGFCTVTGQTSHRVRSETTREMCLVNNDLVRGGIILNKRIIMSITGFPCHTSVEMQGISRLRGMLAFLAVGVSLCPHCCSGPLG